MASSINPGNRIFEILNERGMTQKELSDRTGIPTSTINDWKKKNHVPNSDKITLVCDALNVKPEDIFGTRQTSVDYRVVNKDEPLWALIETYDHMDEEQQRRLLSLVSDTIKI